jgi:hypothetical protein
VAWIPGRGIAAVDTGNNRVEVFAAPGKRD